jgi:hypothetical protein
MSATIKENATKSVSNQEGEIGSHVPRSEPLTTHGVSQTTFKKSDEAIFNRQSAQARRHCL